MKEMFEVKVLSFDDECIKNCIMLNGDFAMAFLIFPLTQL